jgi:hypothetical protein
VESLFLWPQTTFQCWSAWLTARVRHPFPIEERSDIGASMAANLTDEQRLNVNMQGEAIRLQHTINRTWARQKRALRGCHGAKDAVVAESVNALLTHVGGSAARPDHRPNQNHDRSSAAKVERADRNEWIQFGVDITLQIEDDCNELAIFHCRFAAPNPVIVFLQTENI